MRILVSPVASDFASSTALAQSAGSMVDVTVCVVGSMVASDLTTIVLAICCGVAVSFILGVGAVVTGGGTVVGVGVGDGS
ncbi:hypothetical protein D3C73_1115170 [compost metagenome]